MYRNITSDNFVHEIHTFKINQTGIYISNKTDASSPVNTHFRSVF